MAEVPSNLSLSTMETNGRLLLQAVYSLTQTIGGIFPRTVGSATLSGVTTTIIEPAVTASSMITWSPTSAAAASLMGSAANPYLSARTAGASFALTTANGSSASGTILYAVYNTV